MSDVEDNTSRSLNKGGISVLPLLRTWLAICQKYWEPSFWKWETLLFISVCMFDSFKNSFAMITSLSKLYFRFRRFFLLVKTKMFSMSCNHSCNQAVENHGDEWNLTWYLRRETHMSDAMKWSIPFWVRWKVNGNWDRNMIRISQWGKIITELTRSISSTRIG